MQARATQLLTELEIKSLLIRERYYRDTSQWENLRTSYHSDASHTSIKITWYSTHPKANQISPPHHLPKLTIL